jgi:hypothetical protein
MLSQVEIIHSNSEILLRWCLRSGWGEDYMYFLRNMEVPGWMR